MSFQKASKKESKLRLALFAPSGGGKTFTSLRIATGIGGRIAVIDSEKGSASKYADRFDFDVSELSDPRIENYIRLIKEASSYDVLIIDSLTHGWQELLEEVNRIAQAKYRGNTWSAWSEGTPKQRSLVNAILTFPGHIIATMRVKTEWTTEKDHNGKTRPIRVGLSPEQGKGIEYEFDLLIQLSTEHIGHVIKDRTGKFQDELIDKPGEEFGKALHDWLGDGVTAPLKPSFAPSSQAPDPLREPKKRKSRKLKEKPSADVIPGNFGGREKQNTDSPFPLETETHKELDIFLKENKELFTSSHLKWIVDQVLNDSSEEKARIMLGHAKQVCSTAKKAV